MLKISCAVFAAMMFALLATQARAQTLLPSGTEIDGWRITYPQGVNLTLDNLNDSGPVLDLTKTANFVDEGGLLINFNQVSYTGAAAQFAIVSESLTNSTSSPFTSFFFVIASPLGQGQNFANTFNQSTYATTSIDAAGDIVTLTDGSIAPGGTVNWGTGNGGGELLINGNPVTSGTMADFALKEIPGTSAVPLPASVWTSLSGLVGLGLIGAFKKMRHHHHA